MGAQFGDDLFGLVERQPLQMAAHLIEIGFQVGLAGVVAH
jgi:hypothetical protein